MIVYTGKMSRDKVNELFGRSRAGVVLYQPAANHYESQPIKMFEFMAAGLPVVASDFPLWRNIVEKSGCGICVDPTDAKAIKDACTRLLDNPEAAQRMGLLGRRAVENHLNWDVEARKLICLYEDVGYAASCK